MLEVLRRKLKFKKNKHGDKVFYHEEMCYDFFSTVGQSHDSTCFQLVCISDSNVISSIYACNIDLRSRTLTSLILPISASTHQPTYPNSIEQPLTLMFDACQSLGLLQLLICVNTHDHTHTSKMFRHLIYQDFHPATNPDNLAPIFVNNTEKVLEKYTIIVCDLPAPEDNFPTDFVSSSSPAITTNILSSPQPPNSSSLYDALNYNKDNLLDLHHNNNPYSQMEQSVGRENRVSSSSHHQKISTSANLLIEGDYREDPFAKRNNSSSHQNQNDRHFQNPHHSNHNNNNNLLMPPHSIASHSPSLQPHSPHPLTSHLHRHTQQQSSFNYPPSSPLSERLVSSSHQQLQSLEDFVGDCEGKHREGKHHWQRRDGDRESSTSSRSTSCRHLHRQRNGSKQNESFSSPCSALGNKDEEQNHQQHQKKLNDIPFSSRRLDSALNFESLLENRNIPRESLATASTRTANPSKHRYCLDVAGIHVEDSTQLEEHQLLTDAFVPPSIAILLPKNTSSATNQHENYVYSNNYIINGSSSQRNDHSQRLKSGGDKTVDVMGAANAYFSNNNKNNYLNSNSINNGNNEKKNPKEHSSSKKTLHQHYTTSTGARALDHENFIKSNDQTKNSIQNLVHSYKNQICSDHGVEVDFNYHELVEQDDTNIDIQHHNHNSNTALLHQTAAINNFDLDAFSSSSNQLPTSSNHQNVQKVHGGDHFMFAGSQRQQGDFTEDGCLNPDQNRYADLLALEQKRSGNMRASSQINHQPLQARPSLLSCASGYQNEIFYSDEAAYRNFNQNNYQYRSNFNESEFNNNLSGFGEVEAPQPGQEYELFLGDDGLYYILSGYDEYGNAIYHVYDEHAAMMMIP
eukprot:GDKJ01058770.1.p1 GENE.GDKJ01058770.1~~GDKJ01058770.1.p1  ORF type:complete len:857 (+),score=202.18 GDKJ01058770.1:139-2709(+)